MVLPFVLYDSRNIEFYQGTFYEQNEMDIVKIFTDISKKKLLCDMESYFKIANPSFHLKHSILL